MWRKFLRRWWWLGALPVAFSLLTGLCGIVGNLPVFLQAGLSSNSTEILLIFGFIFLQTIVQSLWNLNATAQWVIGVAVGFGSAVTIARERETKNLELLRLTPFPITEIALAKVFAIARQFIWPTVITTAINLLGVFGLAGIAVVSVVVLGGLSGGMLGADIQLAIGAVVVGFLPLITLFLVINTVLDLAYNIAIGLMASCWASTRANAIAYSLVLHFVINMFVLTPLIFLIIIGFSLIGGLLTVITFSPLFIIAALILGAGGAYIVFRAGMVALAGLAAHYQLQRLSE